MNRLEPFKSHENLADEVNKAIVDSEIDGGVSLSNVAVGRGLFIYFRSGYYAVRREEEGFYISSHPFRGEDPHCPSAPTRCKITGSLFAREGSMLKMFWVGRGMHLEFHLNDGPRLVSSTPILEITEY